MDILQFMSLKTTPIPVNDNGVASSDSLIFTIIPQ